MVLAAVLFGIAALGGLVMAVMRLKGRDYPPLALALGHGLLAAGGLVVLLVEYLNGVLPGLGKIAFGIFLLVAIGGFFLFSFHLRKKPLPVPFILIHGIVGITGYGFLLGAILTLGTQ
jgi:hypothetical protein